MFGFLNLVKGWQIYRFSNRLAKVSTLKAFKLLCFVCLGVTPIPYMYVLVAILNLPHPELRGTTVPLDLLMCKSLQTKSLCYILYC